MKTLVATVLVPNDGVPGLAADKLLGRGRAGVSLRIEGIAGGAPIPHDRARALR